MEAEKLAAILTAHHLWRHTDGVEGTRANLYGAALSGANLSGADLSRAALSGANLSGADLSGADLSGAARAYQADKLRNYFPNPFEGAK